MKATAVLAYLLIIGYFVIERLLRKGNQALSLQPSAFDCVSSQLIWISGLFNLLLLIIAPVLNVHKIGDLFVLIDFLNY